MILLPEVNKFKENVFCDCKQFIKIKNKKKEVESFFKYDVHISSKIKFLVSCSMTILILIMFFILKQ
jgi:hypothetical protein